ncbi:MAG TPA: AGE family epimerase/isomerase [Acidimicrobiales bacterium]|nr:AGE family epimerase/isomerase [Acidimicrobiales bacterium]
MGEVVAAATAEAATAKGLVARARSELGNILEFWRANTVDRERGGFYSSVTNNLEVDATAPKGLVLNARILWSFSRAYRHSARPEDLQMADRAAEYLREHFWDEQYGGYFLSVDAWGKPVHTTKQTYGQAFALYGLSEYARATGREDALALVHNQYTILEQAKDAIYGGYHEAFTRDWRPLGRSRLGEEDPDVAKSMNTHIHVLEAYTNAYTALPRPELGEDLEKVFEVIKDRIFDPSAAHLRLFFDEDWASTSPGTSFGHDIEASWLLVEAALALARPEMVRSAREMALQLAGAVAREGLAEDGSVLYERRGGGHLDTDRHWWPQAEGVVGFVSAFQLTGQAEHLQTAARIWDFIAAYILDHRYGEWFWKVDSKGRPDPGLPKVGAWKCPYHNSRACFEVVERLGGIAAGAP